MLGVGGFDRDGNASWDASTQGITIGVAGPSEDLIGINRFGDPQTWSGSSGATPIVSGLVALVRAAHPELDAANVIQRVLATATPVGTVPSPLYGYGRINAAAAVSADVAPVATNPMGSLEEWIRLNRRAAPTDSPTANPIATPAALPLGRLMWPAWGFFAQRYGVPIMFVLVFGSLIALGIAAVTRRVRRRRRESRS